MNALVKKPDTELCSKSDGISDETLFFHSVSTSQLGRGKSSAQKLDFLVNFQTACSSTAFTNFTDTWGIVNASFELNTAACAGNPVYDRFCKAYMHLPEIATLAIVFHGTQESNIQNILEHGLDPAKRTGQAYGPGEYFSTDPGMSTSYCKGGHKMVAFVVVMPFLTNRHEPSCPRDIVVVPTSEHQLPLGVISYDSVSISALSRSSAGRSKLQLLSDQVRNTSEQAAVAKVKANIIQLLIKDSIDVASEVYSKNKDFLCKVSKCEISMYAHRLFDADFVVYYFPDLPVPMTVQERDVAAIKSVDNLEEDLSNAKRKLAWEC